MTLSNRLGITELEETQNNRSVTINEAIAKLEAGATFFAAIQVLLNTPPVSPVEGDLYVVGTAGTGAWSGFNENVTLYYNASWLFFTPFEGMFAWDQTSNSVKYYDGADWVSYSAGGFTAASTTEVLTGTDSAKGVTPDALAALWEKGSDIASAGTISIGEGGYFHVTGTTTITDIDWATAKDGRTATIIFDGILILTHHATTLKLPGGANITTAAGDRATFTQDASDNVICTSYTRADGTAIVSGSTTGKHTIWLPASAILSATTTGPLLSQFETATNDINFMVLDFDASADEHAHFNIAFPKGWDEGPVTFQVFYTTTATGTTGVAWGLQAVAISDNEASDASWGTPVVVTDDAQGAAGEILVTAESGAVTIGGTPAEGDICFFRIFRDISDANDDMTEDARLIGVKVFYTTNAGNDA